MSDRSDSRPPAAPTLLAPEERDRAVVIGAVGEGVDRGLAVLRRRTHDAPVEAGIVRALRQGQAITGDVVTLTQTEPNSPVFDIDVKVPARTATASSPPHKGPARVTTDAYRDQWDAIFGRDDTMN